MSDVLPEGFDKAEQQLFDKANGDINLLPTTVANFLLIYSAQGVIDNGGYEYFFESDWPMNPPYSRFVAAYSAIGCQKQAEDLARVAATFPFESPHLYSEKRNQFMEAHSNEDTQNVEGWGNLLCGDEEVWSKLEAYYLKNISEF